MNTIDVIWWGYTAFILLIALFMIWFALKVRQRGG